MSGLMLPLRIPRPERAEGTVLAALLAALLVVMLIAQGLLPPDRPVVADLPPVILRAGDVAAAPVTADSVLARRSIFQPTRLAGADGGAGPAAPLDGAIPAGVIRVRGAARLVLQTPEGNSITLRTGQSWRGWRLVRIGSDEVRFARGSETVTLGLGADNSYSYPGYAPPAYDPRGVAGAYRPNQADEQ